MTHELIFRETVLDRRAMMRDFAPAGLIVLVALTLSGSFPVDPETGLRPLAASEIIIIGTLSATLWIVVQRLRRRHRRVLAITRDAVRVYPPCSLFALPHARGVPELEIPRIDIEEVRVDKLDTTAGRFVRRNVVGMLPERCKVIAGDRRHCFDDLTWSPDLDTRSRLIHPAGDGSQRQGSRQARAHALRTAFESAGYPVAVGKRRVS